MTPRRFVSILVAAAAAAALLQGMTGLTELALYAAPLVLLVGLLLCGRFVGEERILARLGALRRGPSRAVVTRWRRGREMALASLIACLSHPRRGPPAASCAA